jgi:hypothetical protein
LATLKRQQKGGEKQQFHIQSPSSALQDDRQYRPHTSRTFGHQYLFGVIKATSYSLSTRARACRGRMSAFGGKADIEI